MTKIEELHSKWAENPEYQQAYDELEIEFDAETRFLAQAARGNSKRGLALLGKIAQHFGRNL
jgi:hypothetical protein